jgi:hypothetical protein
LEAWFIKQVQQEKFLRAKFSLFVSPNGFLFLVILEHSGRNRGSFLDKLVDFEVVNDEFFVDSFVFFIKNPQDFVENTEHFSKFFDLFIALFNVASKKKGNGMDTFGADLLSTGLPPQEEQI